MCLRSQTGAIRPSGYSGDDGVCGDRGDRAGANEPESECEWDDVVDESEPADVELGMIEPDDDAGATLSGGRRTSCEEGDGQHELSVARQTSPAGAANTHLVDEQHSELLAPPALALGGRRRRRVLTGGGVARASLGLPDVHAALLLKQRPQALSEHLERDVVVARGGSCRNRGRGLRWKGRSGGSSGGRARCWRSGRVEPGDEQQRPGLRHKVDRLASGGPEERADRSAWLWRARLAGAGQTHVGVHRCW